MGLHSDNHLYAACCYLSDDALTDYGRIGSEDVCVALSVLCYSDRSLCPSLLATETRHDVDITGTDDIITRSDVDARVKLSRPMTIDEYI